MSRAAFTVMIALAALVACEAPPAAEPPRTPPAEPAVRDDPAPSVFPRWNDDGDAAILVLESGAEAPLARLSCPQDELVVQALTFRPIASEDRLTIGVGGEAFATATDLEADGAGVTSRGPAPEGFYDHVERAGPVSLTYGAQTLTSPQLPVDLAGRFAGACRAQ